MKRPLPVEDGWSLLTGCNEREIVVLLAALFRECDSPIETGSQRTTRR